MAKLNANPAHLIVKWPRHNKLSSEICAPSVIAVIIFHPAENTGSALRLLHFALRANAYWLARPRDIQDPVPGWKQKWHIATWNGLIRSSGPLYVVLDLAVLFSLRRVRHWVDFHFAFRGDPVVHCVYTLEGISQIWKWNKWCRKGLLFTNSIRIRYAWKVKNYVEIFNLASEETIVFQQLFWILHI